MLQVFRYALWALGRLILAARYVVLVHTRGVWGSSFSYAQTGKAPLLGRRLLAGAGCLLANLLVLMPRRRVDITVERLDRARLPELTVTKVNPWLEAWYNAEGPE